MKSIPEMVRNNHGRTIRTVKDNRKKAPTIKEKFEENYDPKIINIVTKQIMIGKQIKIHKVFFGSNWVPSFRFYTSTRNRRSVFILIKENDPFYKLSIKDDYHWYKNIPEYTEDCMNGNKNEEKIE